MVNRYQGHSQKNIWGGGLSYKYVFKLTNFKISNIIEFKIIKFYLRKISDGGEGLVFIKTLLGCGLDRYYILWTTQISMELNIFRENIIEN
jgi:hypothetical protein